mmetsp:Transcript_3532/g.8242  ORF Transcript_3532/g.8242 Transcript_3532/m.8242 type:complete len:264 (-) Transcript_3532:250-1041(-)
MVGNCIEKASTSALSAVISAGISLLRYSRKSLSLGPVFSLSAFAISTPRSTNSATLTKSDSTKPRLVSAGAPMRRPPGTIADLSPGTVFLLLAMCASSSTRSTREPSTFLGRRSSSTRWFSVPPETSVWPLATRALASAALFFSTCSWYALNSGVAACFSAHARPEIVWLWGPPCSPGKTEKLILSSMSYMMVPFLGSSLRTPRRKKIMAPRGPRSDLCVVVVTTSAVLNGPGTTSAATRPEMCAMSASSHAPTLSAMARMRV